MSAGQHVGKALGLDHRLDHGSDRRVDHGAVARDRRMRSTYAVRFSGSVVHSAVPPWSRRAVHHISPHFTKMVISFPPYFPHRLMFQKMRDAHYQEPSVTDGPSTKKHVVRASFAVPPRVCRPPNVTCHDNAGIHRGMAWHVHTYMSWYIICLRLKCLKACLLTPTPTANESQGRPSIRGNHLSETTCLTQVFFNSYKYFGELCGEPCHKRKKHA